MRHDGARRKKARRGCVRHSVRDHGGGEWENLQLHSCFLRCRSWPSRVLGLGIATRSPSGARPLALKGVLKGVFVNTGTLRLFLVLADGDAPAEVFAAFFWSLGDRRFGVAGCCSRCARRSELRRLIRLFNSCMGRDEIRRADVEGWAIWAFIKFPKKFLGGRAGSP